MTSAQWRRSPPSACIIMTHGNAEVHRVFSRLGAMLGMGSATVEIALPSAQVFRGSDIVGSVVLMGGRVSQRVRLVTADLYEYWIRGHGKNRRYYQRRHERLVLAEYLPVDPNFEQQFAFRFRVPDDARCTRRREGWEVRVEAHIPWSVDSRASAPIRVIPHAEILAVQRATRDWLKFQPLEWDGSGAEVYYNFRAPNEMREVLDGLALRISVTDDMVEVKAEFNKQERTMRERLGSLVGADRERVGITIPRAELLSKRGTPLPAGAYPHMAALLQRIGIVPPPPPVAVQSTGGSEG